MPHLRASLGQSGSGILPLDVIQPEPGRLCRVSAGRGHPAIRVNLALLHLPVRGTEHHGRPAKTRVHEDDPRAREDLLFRVFRVFRGSNPSPRSSTSHGFHAPTLVSYLTNGWCFAARDFRVPRGASDGQARRGLRGASHDVGGEKRRGPSGCSRNAPGLRGSSVPDRCGQASSSRLAPGRSWSNPTPAIC